jgi:oligopeptide/dipeptide ABC transporter ATP-binding protein
VSAALLSVRNLTVRYSADRRSPALTAVRGVSLDIHAGEILGLVGESGCGKSSLARAILRLQDASSGRILFQGANLLELNRAGLRAARRHIQAVFQDPLASLSPRRSICQTLVEPLEQFRIGDRSKRKQRAAEALATVGLERRLLDRYPRELSGGQRQRVALARALIVGPRLIVADEPVSSLDLPAQVRMTGLIRELRDQLGIAFLFVSHDLSVVRRLADSIAVMYSGGLVESGPANAVFEQPAHPYTRALLRAIPIPDPGHPAPAVLAGDTPSPLTPPSGCVFHKRCAEALPVCSQNAPREIAVTARAGNETGHRVRCHLWIDEQDERSRSP